MEDLTGKQLGSYQVVEPLGEGGMAAVYKAYQPAMDRYVALKILPRHFAKDPQFSGRFQQEARILARLQHPHILPVFDFGQVDDYAYIVMPFIESGTLTHLMRGQPLPWDQIRRIVSQVGDALDYAHTRGLIHRDVKPSNVLIDERSNCLLMDFGLAKLIEGSIHLTHTGAIMGTPAYMSPEQGLGQKLAARSDIYSLGVILYELATGRVPYQAETPMAVVIKHIHDPLPPPRTFNAALPDTLERVILKSLAKNPEDRFATAGEMVKALQAAIPEAVSAPTLKEIPVPAPGPDQTVTVAGKAAAARPLWLPVLISTAGWALGAIFGLVFLAFSPVLIVGIAGAAGGLGIGLAWRRIEPPVTPGQALSLAVIWALALGIAPIFRPLFFIGTGIMGGIAGFLTCLVMRKVHPGLARKQVAFTALGWGLSWFFGGVLFALATRMAARPLSALLILLAFTLAGAVGSGITFAQYRRG
jgi:hypothetical protein